MAARPALADRVAPWLLATFAASLSCSDSPGPAPVGMKESAVLGAWNSPSLRTDFRVTSAAWGENGLRAIPPRTNGACWNGGAAVMSLGQTIAGSPTQFGGLLSRPLYTNGATVDTATLATPASWPNLNATEAMTTTDNNIIRMRDGSIVASHITKTWATMNPAPSWSNTLVSYGGAAQKAGARNELLLERSTDCGNTWQRFGTMDAGLVAGGKYGAPQTAKGTPPPWVGGWDRPELYADPFSSWLFAATDADHDTTSNGLILGAPTGNATSNPDPSTWQVLGVVPSSAPYVMTTTPNKRFYAFTCKGSTPTLYWATSPTDPTTLNGGVNLQSLNGSLPACGRDPNSDLGINGTPNVGIGRAPTSGSPSTVRVVYQAVGANGLQVIATALVTIDDATGTSATVQFTGSVGAADTQHSAVFASLIEPDYVDLPAAYGGNKTLPSVLYWYEATTTSNGNADPAPNLCVRFMVLGSGIANPGPYSLNRTNGTPACFAINKGSWFGDYMTGGFMWDRRRFSFVAQWPEPDGTHASIIRVSPTGKVVSQLGLPGDVDGNGAADIIAARTGDAIVAMSSAGTTFTVGSPGATGVGANGLITTGDFNGDGLTDIASVPPSGNHYTTVALSSGNGTFTTSNSATDLTPYTNQSGAQLFAGDFDGDGLTDLVVLGPAGWNSIPVAFNAGTAGLTFNVVNKLNVSADAFFAAVASQVGAKIVVGDFDGDGRDDLAATGGTQPNGSPWNTIPVVFSNGDGTFRSTNLASTYQTFSGDGTARVYAGDWNGDGRTDLAVLQVWPGGLNTIPLALSNGDGSFTIQNLAGSGSSFFAAVAAQPYAHTVTGDWNGDGLDDLAATGGEQFFGGPQWGTLPVALSNGDGTFASYNPSTTFQTYTQLNGATTLSSWK